MEVIKILIFGLILGVFALVTYGGIFVGTASITYSEGERYGQVTKLSHKGFLVKTWEGELFTQTSPKVFDRSNAIGTYFQFSVIDDKVVEKIKNHAKNGDYVSLIYKQRMHSFFWQGDTDYIIVDVNGGSGE